MKKELIANEVFRFFKSFIYSFLLGLATFILTYVVLFQVPMTFNSNLSVVDYNRKTGFTFGDKIQSTAVHYFIHEKNNSLFQFPTSKEIAKYYVSEALEIYKKDKTNQSIFYSLLVFLGLPVLLSLTRVIFISIKSSADWINTNKTV